MPQRQSPANQAGAPSLRDHFAEHVNREGMIPIWLHQRLAEGILRHFGRDGLALVHPHPSTGYTPADLGAAADMGVGAQGGGVVTAGQPNWQPAVQPATAGRRGPQVLAGEVPPQATAANAPAPLAGLPPNPRASIFAGGTMGAGGPVSRTPVFAQAGGAIDGTGGGKVPGKDLGRDSVHALLEPGEAIFNKKQLAGIKVKPGKEHLVRSDQKKAMSKAGKNASGK